jgi:hypothetical protein
MYSRKYNVKGIRRVPFEGYNHSTCFGTAKETKEVSVRRDGPRKKNLRQPEYRGLLIHSSATLSCSAE